MNVTSISNKHSEIFKEINNWIERENDISYSTSTVFIDESIIPEHIKKARNKSIFIRECCEKFLNFLKIRYNTPRIIAISRSEFVRLSMLMHDLGITEPSPLRDPDYIPDKSRKTIYKHDNGAEVVEYRIKKRNPLGNGFYPNKDYTNKEVLRI